MICGIRSFLSETFVGEAGVSNTNMREGSDMFPVYVPLGTVQKVVT